jgi:hypothetical protein
MRIEMWNLTRDLQRFIDENDTVLDVMCGRCDPTRDLKARLKVGVDLFRPSLQEVHYGGSHLVMNMDARDIPNVFMAKSFDVVLWMNSIEHATMEDSANLLEKLEIVARKSVLVFTVETFFDNKDSEEYHSEGKLQEHLSDWPRKFFTRRGYIIWKRYSYKGTDRKPYLAVKMVGGGKCPSHFLSYKNL